MSPSFPPPASFVHSLATPTSLPRHAPIPQVSPRLRPRPRSVRVHMAAAKKARNYAPTIHNRVAASRYEFLQTHECGIELLGTEVKSLRLGQANLRDSYAVVRNAQLYLRNMHVSQYKFASPNFNHHPTRERKLLLHKKTIRQLQAHVAEKGLTLVPTRLYFANGYAKIEIALAKGKNLRDRREDIKKRDDDRYMRQVEKTAVRTL